MKEKNDRKSDQLGMSFGTANGRLRKMILFDLVKTFGLDDCYRCSLKIETIEDFTIEHKKAWLDVDPKLFWDLNNIAFSHMSCNVGAARKNHATTCFKCRKNPPKLNALGYAKECTECNSGFKREWRARTGKA